MAQGTKLRICDCCSQVIAPEWDAGGPVKQRIYDLIRRHPGLDRNEIMWRIYDKIDGGPEYSNVISVHVKGINDKLKAQGLRIRSKRWSGYRVEMI